MNEIIPNMIVKETLLSWNNLLAEILLPIYLMLLPWAQSIKKHIVSCLMLLKKLLQPEMSDILLTRQPCRTVVW